MGNTTFTISTTTELLKDINVLITKNQFKNTSDFFNKTGLARVNDLKSRYLSDFIYYLGFPTLAFLSMVFVCLTFPSFFIYIITIIVGIYIVILFYLFYNKYRGSR